MHVVCQWIGNSQPIAAKHYLQVTADHFSKALQKALQQPAVLPRTGSQAGLAAQEKTPVLQGSAAECDVVPVASVPPERTRTVNRSLRASAEAPSFACSGDTYAGVPSPRRYHAWWDFLSSLNWLALAAEHGTQSGFCVHH